MNWVQSKFTDFKVPPSKKPKVDDKFSKTFGFQTFNGSQFSKNGDQPRIKKPRTSSDLVVNKKKVDEVRKWLENCLTTKHSSVLLLTGPPGCGKLTTLKVLGSELKFNLSEYLPQIAQRKYDPENGEFYQSASSLFEEFVLRATRYSNVLNSMARRLIVVKDVPNCYVRDPTIFHEFLGKFTQIPNVFLAFIFTDNQMVRSLFPEQVKNTLNVFNVNFNPITQKGVKDVLITMFPSRSPSFAEEISVSCNGDLRNAIATYEFVVNGGAKPKPKSKSKQKNTEEKERGDFMDIFRGLGRVLYGKREKSGQLTYDPVEVAESFVSCPDLFVGMLQENYLQTYSSVHDLAKSSAVLSTGDVCLSESRDTLTSRSTSLSLVSFGLMSQNSAPLKKFQQFNKPQKFVNSLTEFRSKFSDVHTALDVVSLGRSIPSFVEENRDILSRLHRLK